MASFNGQIWNKVQQGLRMTSYSLNGLSLSNKMGLASCLGGKGSMSLLSASIYSRQLSSSACIYHYKGRKNSATKRKEDRQEHLRHTTKPYISTEESLFKKMIELPSNKTIYNENVLQYAKLQKSGLLIRINEIQKTIQKRDQELKSRLKDDSITKEQALNFIQSIDTSLDEELKLSQSLLIRFERLLNVRKTENDSNISWKDTFNTIQNSLKGNSNSKIIIDIRLNNFGKTVTDHCFFNKRPYIPKSVGYPSLLVLAEGEEAIEAKKRGAGHVGGQELLDQVVDGSLKVDKIICQDTLFPEFRSYGKYLGPMKLMFSPAQKTVFKKVSDILQNQDEVFSFTIKDDIVSLHIANGNYTYEEFLDNKEAFISVIKNLLRKSNESRKIVDVKASNAASFREINFKISGTNELIKGPIEKLEQVEKLPLDVELHNSLPKLNIEKSIFA